MFALAAHGSGSAAAAPTDVEGGAQAARQYRELAPGVETAIPLARDEEETIAVHDIVELEPGVPDLDWQPQEYPKTRTLFDKAQGAIFRRGVWQLQFTFKPLRMIRVDIPQPGGKMKTTLVWYMVYRVTNPGQHMTPVRGGGDQFTRGSYTVARADRSSGLFASIGPHRFLPTFLLRTFPTAELKVSDSTVQYMDEIIPAAKRPIYLRERPACPLDQFHDTVQIGADPVPVSSGRVEISRWGYVTWTNLDPTVDFFTVQILGLTNAYRWVDPTGAFRPGDPPGTGRQFEFKTLQLNFYRPGDEFDARENEIRLGVAGHPKEQWLFRPNPTTFQPVHPKQ